MRISPTGKRNKRCHNSGTYINKVHFFQIFAKMGFLKSCIFSVSCLFGFFNVCFTSFQLAELLSSQIPWQIIEPGESHFDGSLVDKGPVCSGIK